jgi:Effector Associated Constant Component 1
VAASSDILISFSDTDMATANEWAGELEESLAEDTPDLSVTRLREDPHTQDFGATLVIILGSTAVTALAKGIASWLARRQDAQLRLKRTTSDGQVHEITVRGQPSARTERIVTDFFTD